MKVLESMLPVTCVLYVGVAERVSHSRRCRWLNIFSVINILVSIIVQTDCTHALFVHINAYAKVTKYVGVINILIKLYDACLLACLLVRTVHNK